METTCTREWARQRERRGVVLGQDLLAQPRWATPTRVTFVSMVAAAVGCSPGVLIIFAAVMGSGVIRFADDTGLPVAASTVLLSAVLAGWAVRPGNGSHPGRVIVFAAVLGACNTGLGLMFGMLAGGQQDEALWALFVGSVLGVLFGSPFGVLYGVGFLPPYCELHRLRGEAPLVRLERVSAVCGWWLAGIGVVAALLALPTRQWWVGLIPCVLSAVVLARWLVVRRRRLEFLRRVAWGAEPEWSFAQRDERHRDLELLALSDCHATDCDVVLTRCETDARGPYRAAGFGTPVALVTSRDARPP